MSSASPASAYAFNPVPRIYDEVLGPVYFEGYAKLMAERVAKTGIRSVLETACGTGRVTHHLAMLPVSLTATDINPAMLEYAREKLKDKGVDHWKQADAVALPFEDQSFDAVTCQFGVMFFPDKKKGFSEAWRVLRPGGFFLFSVWDALDKNPLAATGREAIQDIFEGNPPAALRTAFSMYDPVPVVKLLEDSGFEQIRYEHIPLTCEASSARDFARAFVEASSVREALQSFGPDRIEDLCRRLEATLGERFGNPVKSTQQAILFTAVKSGSAMPWTH